MPKDKEQDLFGTLGDEHVLPRIKPLSRVHRRLIRSAVEIEADDPESLLFQHTVFCQTGLPYRDPGADAREWEREQGSVALKVQAGEARNPDTGKWVKLGLPWGSKPRLILTHSTARPYGVDRRRSRWRTASRRSCIAFAVSVPAGARSACSRIS